MKRFAGSLLVLGLITGAIWIGLNSGKPPLPTYSLVSDNAQEMGVLTVRPGSELCWELSLEALPKAIQLHHDDPGPASAPVVASFYEPPGSPKAEGCVLLPPEYTRLLTQDHTVFYVDGHDSEDEPTVFRAELVSGSASRAAARSGHESRLECEDDLAQATSVLVEGPGTDGSPADAVRVALRGLRETDVLVDAGGARREVLIFRDHKLIGKASAFRSGEGGWLVDSSTVCASSGIRH